MFKKAQLRRLLEGKIAENRDDRRQGGLAFVREIHESLGLMTSDRGNPLPSRHDSDRPCLEACSYSPWEYSLRDLAEVTFGHQFYRFCDPSDPEGPAALMESAGGIYPTAFQNINLFNLATAGLVMAEILRKFNNPELIGLKLVKTVPTKKNGDKIIGVTNVGDKALTRAPGQEYPEAGFGEEWVETPATIEKALKCVVQQEAAYFDLTGDVLTRAGGIGTELSYNQEGQIADGVMGVTNTYKYNGTAYNTFQTASPWLNDASNPVSDWRDLDEADQLLMQMTDPATGKEITVVAKDLICMPGREKLWNQVLHSTYVEGRTATTQAVVMGGANPIKSGINLHRSPIWRNRAISGLSLTANQAVEYWWYGDFAEAFQWRENWPLRTRQASATEFMMMNRGILGAYFSDLRGRFAVVEPRFVVRQKN